MSAITLNGNLLSNAMAIENNSYNNYDNSQRYEKDNSDKYGTDPSQQSKIMKIIMDTKTKINPLKYFQLTKYQNLEMRWWQWVTSLNNTTDANPFTDLGQSGCDVGLQDDGKLSFLLAQLKVQKVLSNMNVELNKVHLFFFL